MSAQPLARAATPADGAAIATSYNHKLTSRVFASNPVSLALLTRLGFREVGRHEKHAALESVWWHDVVVVERLLPANLR